MTFNGFFLFAAAAASVAGCATVTTGTDDTVTIDTDPSGAICRLSAKGEQVAVVNPTPGSISVPKSRADLDVACELDGHLVSEGVIASDVQAMTFGNVLLGGAVGVAIDAASGAMNEYEPGVRITMIPEAFADAQARDAFFAQVEADVQASHEASLAKMADICGDEDNCARERLKAEKKRDAVLENLAAKRAQTRILPAQPAT